MKKFCIIIFIALFSIAGSAQNIRNRQNIRNNPSKSANIRKDLSSPKPKKVPETSASKQSEPDTVYALRTIKKYGWYIPHGVLTKEQASHNYSTCVFTRKNKEGNWTRVEVIDSYGNYVPGFATPYILQNGDNDDGANEDWKNKIKESCIVEFISDPTGKEVVQERVYNKNHKLLYAFSRTPIGEVNGLRQFVGTYKDFYGLPAEMRETPGYTYGTLVKITEDEWGHDHIIEYMDARGVYKLNADSVYRSVHNYNEFDDELSVGSQNAKGEYVIDSWGNCGSIYTWNEDHTPATATCTDNNWNPIAMPSEKANERCGVIKSHWKYDKYKRTIEERFVDADDKPMTNIYGAHRVKSEYDDKGNTIKRVGYGLNGEYSPIDASGTAIYEVTYDEKGRQTSIRFLDENENPNPKAGYLSGAKRKYDEKGNIAREERYSAETGPECLCSMVENTPEYSYNLWNDGTSRVDSLDAKGRKTFIGFYGADGKLMNTEGRATEVYTYEDRGKQMLETRIVYDENGEKGDIPEQSGIYKVVILVDSLNWSKTFWRYDKNDVLADVYTHSCSPNFENVLYQEDLNAFGVTSRAGGSSSVMYYKGNVMYSQQGKIVSLYGKDEFGEPDYIMSSGLTYYYQKQFPHSATKFYDVNNREIEDGNGINNRLPKLMTIEVTDSAAYNLGLRDNDLILVYGDYVADIFDVQSYIDFRKNWTVRTVLGASQEKRMVVFRITDASKNKYGLYEIRGLKGTCSELGFLAHIRCLTEKQMLRVQGAVLNETHKPEPLISQSDYDKVLDSKGGNFVVLSYPDMFRSNRNYNYPREIVDPSVLLASCIQAKNMKWTRENYDDYTFDEMLSTRTADAMKYPRQDFYFTKDGKNIIHFPLYGRSVATNWIGTYISDEDYKKLSNLYAAACDSVNAVMSKNTPEETKKFFGTWKSLKNSSVDYPAEMAVNFAKDGTCECKVVNYGSISFTEGRAVYKIENHYTGSWTYGGEWLFITPGTENITISCVDLIGPEDENFRQYAVSYLNSICESSKDVLLKEMTYDENKIENDFTISSFGKDSFDAELSSWKRITFVKTKSLDITDAMQENTAEVAEATQAIDENSPYIGFWSCTMPEFQDSRAEFDLCADGQLLLDVTAVVSQPIDDKTGLELHMDINVLGTWQPRENGFNISIDASKLDFVLDFDMYGVDEETKALTLPALKQELDGQKQQFAMSFLDSFGSEMTVTEIDSVRMVMNDNVFTRIPYNYELVYGTIEGATGYLVEQGFRGHFVVLEWCDWNCRHTIDDFSAEFVKQKENEKHLVLLPVEFVNDKAVFKDVIEINCPKDKLGIRVVDTPVGYLYYKQNVLARYKEYLRSKKQ